MKTLLTTVLLSLVILAQSQPRNLNTRVPAGSEPVSNKQLNTNEAKEIIQDIMDVVGLKPTFEVFAANISNAAAVVTNGKRYIFYNPSFIHQLNIAGGNKWASVSVLAHEIGHHLNGHTLKNTGSQPPLELEADEFSGFVMRKMGATLEQAQAGMKIAAEYKPSLTHPGQENRMTAIAGGWNKAGGQAANADVAKYNAPVNATDTSNAIAAATDQNGPANNDVAANNNVVPEAAGAVIDESNIVGDVYFPSDKDGSYFLTTRHNLVKISNGKLYLAGKLVPTNSDVYPYSISSATGTKTRFLVDKKGKIVTLKGNAAGFIKTRE